MQVLTSPAPLSTPAPGVPALPTPADAACRRPLHALGQRHGNARHVQRAVGCQPRGNRLLHQGVLLAFRGGGKEGMSMPGSGRAFVTPCTLRGLGPQCALLQARMAGHPTPSTPGLVETPSLPCAVHAASPDADERHPQEQVAALHRMSVLLCSYSCDLLSCINAA